ncbi:hypothetical protein ACIBO2_17835 [Nonomuraea sp. NPDC050022]|uniref:hypothetical protein n=1 Tax=unclassified Nonomuraea TaxID=2593643 RepID=UPI0033E52CBD
MLLRTAVIGLTIARDSRRLSRRHFIVTATAVVAIGGVLVMAETLFADDLPQSAVPVAAAQGRLPTQHPRPAKPSPSTSLEPTTTAQLRAALATGRLGLEALLSRREATTIRADLEPMLRALPGRTPAEIDRTLRQAKIDADASIGDLTLRQRHLLLTALGEAPANPSR